MTSDPTAQEPVPTTIAEIYNAIAAGKQLNISFISTNEAESFRVQLARYKKQQEEYIEAAFGPLSDKQSLSFSNTSNSRLTYLVQLRPKQRQLRYTVEVISVVDTLPPNSEETES